MCAGFGISQGMVMVFKVVSAGSGNRLQLMISNGVFEMFTRSSTSVVKHIVRIIHLINPKDFFQTSLIKRRVMRHKWQTLNHRRNFFPHTREYRRIIGLLFGKTMHLLTEPFMVFRLWTDKAIEPLHYFTTTNYHHSD